MRMIIKVCMHYIFNCEVQLKLLISFEVLGGEYSRQFYYSSLESSFVCVTSILQVIKYNNQVLNVQRVFYFYLTNITRTLILHTQDQNALLLNTLQVLIFLLFLEYFLFCENLCSALYTISQSPKQLQRKIKQYSKVKPFII